MYLVWELTRCKCHYRGIVRATILQCLLVSVYQICAHALATHVIFPFFGCCHSKTLVASRSDTVPLRLTLLRGTAAMADHEAALTELCTNPDTSDEEAEQCVLDFLQGGYYADSGTDDSVVVCEEDDAENECVLDDLHNMWATDLPSVAQPPKAETTKPSSTTTATKPWNSRSSPSGTYVRDPTTRKMRNIDL
jgi:hypothetical protein